MPSLRPTTTLLACIVAACGSGCRSAGTERNAAKPPYVALITQGLDSTDPAARERALQQWDALPPARKTETGIWVHRHASDRAWLAGAMFLDEDLLYRGSFDDTRILAERWLRLAGRNREWYIANGFSERSMHAHEAAGLADLGRSFPASAGPAVAAALEAGRIEKEFREEAIAFILAVGGPRVASLLKTGITLTSNEREQAEEAGLLAPEEAPPDEGKPPERIAGTAEALDWIYGAPGRPLSRLNAVTRTGVVAELREVARDSTWLRGTARLLAEAIASEGLPAWNAVLDRVVAERQPELLRALPRELAQDWIGRRPGLGARLPAGERDLLTGAATPAPLGPIEGDDSEWLSLDRLVQLVRWRAPGALADLHRLRERSRQKDLPLLAHAALTGDNAGLRAFFEYAPLGRIEELFLLEDLRVFVGPGVVDALLELMRRGQRSSVLCQRTLAEVFRAQVDPPSESASPAVLIQKAALWTDWWNREGRKWSWDPWSKRYWPAREAVPR